MLTYSSGCHFHFGSLWQAMMRVVHVQRGSGAHFWDFLLWILLAKRHRRLSNDSCRSTRCVFLSPPRLWNEAPSLPAWHDFSSSICLLPRKADGNGRSRNSLSELQRRQWHLADSPRGLAKPRKLPDVLTCSSETELKRKGLAKIWDSGGENILNRDRRNHEGLKKLPIVYRKISILNCAFFEHPVNVLEHTQKKTSV